MDRSLSPLLRHFYVSYATASNCNRYTKATLMGGIQDFAVFCVASMHSNEIVAFMPISNLRFMKYAATCNQILFCIWPAVQFSRVHNLCPQASHLSTRFQCRSSYVCSARMVTNIMIVFGALYDYITSTCNFHKIHKVSVYLVNMQVLLIA